MLKNFFSVAYCLFLIFTVCIGGMSFIGPISFFHIGTILMFVVLFFKEKFIYFDKYLGIYSVFVLSYFICSSVTGYIDEALNKIITFYFIGYLGYASTILLVSRYKNEKLLTNLLVIIGIINAIFILGQFTHNATVLHLTELLGINDNEYLKDIEGRSEAASFFYMPGIFGVVYSGYMTMVCSIISAKYQVSRLSILGLLLSILLLVVCFMVQERSSFAIGIVFTLYLIVRALHGNISNKNKLWSLVLFIVLICVAGFALFKGYDILMQGESRMANVGLDVGRDEIYSEARKYIDDNPLITGFERFNATYHSWPHNLLLNAYVYGGFFGFLAIIVLLISMFVKMTPFLLKKITKGNAELMVLGIAFLAYNANSLVHNNSIVTGDTILWVLWGCVYALIRRTENSKKRSV